MSDSSNTDLPKFSVGGFALTFPWFAYPRLPFSGYYDEEYFPELERLYMFMEQLSNSREEIVFHITIGAPADELWNRTNDWKNSKQHYRQLIPIHLQEAVMQGMKIISIIITPNDISKPHFTKPHAVTDSGLEFEEFGKRSWRLMPDCVSQTNGSEMIGEWEIYWFQTLMPSNDLARNKRMMEDFIRKGIDRQIPGGINKYMQTTDDIEFVRSFYNLLTSTCMNLIRHGSIVTCFNLAVFNANGAFTRFNNCRMFCEIKEVFSTLALEEQGERKSILLEWVFRENNFHVYEIKTRPVNSSNDLVAVNYVRYSTRSSDGNEICNEDYPEVALSIYREQNMICLDLIPSETSCSPSMSQILCMRMYDNRQMNISANRIKVSRDRRAMAQRIRMITERSYPSEGSVSRGVAEPGRISDGRSSLSIISTDFGSYSELPFKIDETEKIKNSSCFLMSINDKHEPSHTWLGTMRIKSTKSKSTKQENDDIWDYNSDDSEDRDDMNDEFDDFE